MAAPPPAHGPKLVQVMNLLLLDGYTVDEVHDWFAPFRGVDSGLERAARMPDAPGTACIGK